MSVLSGLGALYCYYSNEAEYTQELKYINMNQKHKVQ